MDLAFSNINLRKEIPAVQIVLPEKERPPIDEAAVTRLARHFQTQIRSARCSDGRSVLKPEHLRPTLRLYITNEPQGRPFKVDFRHGITVTTWQCPGICRYTGIDEETYLLLCSLLGLTQWRTLALNDLIQVEDFNHDSKAHCLFWRPPYFSEFALLLENPAICEGCRNFYHCLGAELELLAVRHVVQRVCRQTRP